MTTPVHNQALADADRIRRRQALSVWRQAQVCSLLTRWVDPTG